MKHAWMGVDKALAAVLKRARPAPVIDASSAGMGALLADALRSRHSGPEVVRARQAQRLLELARFARARSGFYRQLCAGLPLDLDDVGMLPVTSKARLMSSFDDVVTDPRITREGVEAFVADPSRIGKDFLGAYSVAATSGTTGVRGLFVLDAGSFKVGRAMGARMVSSWLSASRVVRIIAGGGRTAMICASGGHFASAVAAAKLRGTAWGERLVRVFGVQAPMPELVAGLNSFRPAVLAPYAATAGLLAEEQEAGRLDIHPALVVLAAEGVSPDRRRRIAAAFGALVTSSYAATECPFLSYSCREDWLHVNSDWVILEPVDADYRPVPAGRQSYSVLITNLANRVQPIIRYDLGDSVLLKEGPCACGNPLPALRVTGRSADVLSFPTPAGATARISALTISALTDRLPGIELAQIIQTAPDRLRVRFRPGAGVTADQAWEQLHAELRGLLAAHGGQAALHPAPEPPAPTAGGKYRLVQPLPPQI